MVEGDADLDFSIKFRVHAGLTIRLEAHTHIDHVTPWLTRLEQLKELRALRKSIVDGFEGVLLGTNKDHRALQERCAAIGLKSCTALSCRAGVLPLADFSAHKNKSDGKDTRCKQCHHSKDAIDAAKAQKRKAREAVEARGEQKDKCGTETAAVNALLLEIRALGYVGYACLEFRRPDVVVRCSTWPPDLYVRFQIKSDGALHDDGTPKPNDSDSRSASIVAANLRN